MRFTRKLGFALLAAGLGLGLLEGGARVLEALLPPPTRALPTPDPDCAEPCIAGAARLPMDQPGAIQMVREERRGWGFAPGSQVVQGHVIARINRLGLRGPDPGPKEEGELRLLTLGDSTVFGYGVEEEEVFSSVAAELLAAQRGAPVQAFNGAIPGHSAPQSLAVLQEVGAEIQPDLVVIANLWSDLYQAPDGLTDALDPAGPRSASALYRLGLRVLAPYLPAPRVSWVDFAEGRGTPGAGRHARTPIADYHATQQQIAAEAGRLGARPIFLLLPAPVDLDPVGPPAQVRAYRDAMAEVARELGAPLVDGPGWFAAHGAALTDFYDQVHPSVSGHRALGEALAAGLALTAPGGGDPPP